MINIVPTKQTHWTAAELRANPEYTNVQAYQTLESEVFPFNLPFSLWQVQTRAYLDHLGVPQARLMKLFQQDQASLPTPNYLQIDAAWLTISDMERLIITGMLTGRRASDYWGLQRSGNNLVHPETPTDITTNVQGTWVHVLTYVPIMLHRTQTTYWELLQLLDTSFINPARVVAIAEDSSAGIANCDTNNLRINGLDAVVLDRFHRFVRLWRKMDCPIWTLDRLITSITPGQINNLTLHTLAQIGQLREKFGWDWAMAQALFYNIDHSLYTDYSQLGTPQVETLYQRLFLNKLVDAIAPFPKSPGSLSGTILSKAPGILAAFQMKEADLDLILAHFSLTPAHGSPGKS